MAKRHEHPLMEDVLAMLDRERKDNGSTGEPSVIGANLDVKDRIKILDALRPTQLHARRHMGKFRGKPLGEVHR